MKTLFGTMGLLVLALLVLTGCSSPMPIPPATAVAAATIAATPVPSDTPTVAPTSTPTSVPTDTPSPTVTSTTTIAPTNTPAGTATPPAAPGLQFSVGEDFEGSCPLGTGSNDNAAWGCEKGQYSILHKVANYSMWVPYRSTTYNDVVVEADVQLTTTSGVAGAGLATRISPTTRDLYVFAIRSDGNFYILFYNNNKAAILMEATPSSYIRPNAVNRLKMVSQGQQLAVYANGYWLATVNNASLTLGRVGFYLASQNINGRAAFDNLRIYRVVQPQTLPVGAPTVPTRATVPPQPTAPPASSKYDPPPGQGTVVIRNFYGADMTFTIDNHQHTVPANGEEIIFLAPGKYPWSAFIPGKGQAHGTTEVEAGEITGVRFSD